jgi:hypothetical protein
MRCCAGDEGFVALRSRPTEGGFKPPHAALAEDRRGECAARPQRGRDPGITQQMTSPARGGNNETARNPAGLGPLGVIQTQVHPPVADGHSSDRPPDAEPRGSEIPAANEA